MRAADDFSKWLRLERHLELSAVSAADVEQRLARARADEVHRVLEFPPLRFLERVERIALSASGRRQFTDVEAVGLFEHRAGIRHVTPIEIDFERALRDIVVALDVLTRAFDGLENQRR